MTAILDPPAPPLRASRPRPVPTPSEQGRRRLEEGEGAPPFVGDWRRTLFIHYAVDPAALQRFVPFPLDLRDGAAWVSLVAFTQEHLRFRVGGALTSWATRPLATHSFLNVRTYVTQWGEPGIYFLAEWLPNRLATLVGPPLFGLPYRHGRLDFRHDHRRGVFFGSVVPDDAAGALRYVATTKAGTARGPSAPGSLAEFLCERYSAFTWRAGRTRRFRIWHPPWPLRAVDADVQDDSLLGSTGDWLDAAQRAGAHESPGVDRVWIGRPQSV